MGHLFDCPTPCPDWIVTVAFYKALHLVEALIFKDQGLRHGRNHAIRERILKCEPRYGHIYRHYMGLKEASCVARYLQNSAGTKSYQRFEDYCTMEGVKRDLLNHRLHQLEQSVRKLIA